jgi:hypothetical protein
MGGFNLKRGTNLETKLLNIRHIPRPKCFNLIPWIYVLKMAFSNVHDLPRQKKDAPPYQMIVPRVLKNT